MRLVSKLVRGLGTLALAASLSYCIGVVAAVLWIDSLWASFWLQWGPALVAVPVVLLLVYLGLRSRAGAILLANGRPREAMSYTEQYREPGWTTSRLEALYHWVAFVRAALRAGELERARTAPEVSSDGRWTGRLCARLEVWRLEVRLRAGDLCEDGDVSDGSAPAAGSPEVQTRWWAAAAEAAALDGESERFDRCVEEADSLQRDHPRTMLSRIYATAHLNGSGHTLRDAAEALERRRRAWSRAVPGREAELLALRAEFARRLDEVADARRWLVRAEDARADGRSERVVAIVARRVDRGRDAANR